MRRCPIAPSPAPSPSRSFSTRRENASMVEDFLRQSPLSHLALAARGDSERAAGHGVVLAERPFRSVVTLRGQVDDAAFAGAVHRIVGLGLPHKAGQVAGDPKGREILCLGPDEWWLTDAAEEAEDLVGSLEKAAEGLFAQIVDTSDNWFALELAGPRARDLLAKACPLDLHPRNFGPGRCAQSLLSKVPLTLKLIDDQTYFLNYCTIDYAAFARLRSPAP